MAHEILRSNLGGLAKMAAGGFGKPKEGLVSSYDPDAGAVKVRLQPEDIETGWCPIQLLMAGAGFGVYAGPAVGDLALILFAEGDVDHGICVGFLPNDEDRPPRVESGELHLIHKDGAHLKFLNDGTIVSKGRWVHDGDFEPSGDIKGGGDITDNIPSNDVTVKTLRDKYDAHAHTGVQTGGGTSGGTNQPT